MKKDHPNTSTPSSNTVTTREKAIEWWDNLGEYSKVFHIARHEEWNEQFAFKMWNEWQGHLTDAKIEQIYLSEHPIEAVKEESSNREEEIKKLKEENSAKLGYNNHLEEENKRLKEERQILLDALRPLAELDLEGVNTSLDGNVVYQRNKTYINVGDVYKAREALKQVTK